MTVSTTTRAALAADAYNTYPIEAWQDGVVVEGVRYEILDQVSNGSGYQGTLYRNTQSGEMVVAHRGTEFDRELVKDGLLADAGMVMIGVNTQADDALAFTRKSVETANRLNAAQCQVPDITVTGHSLGGTLAQITAYELGLKGETFNAYGAAGLVADLPAGGTQVMNHVRSTDFVSAASAHFGEVRMYAPQPDIDALFDKGYANDGRVLTDLRNPLGVAFGIGMKAHYGRNFLPDNDLLGESVVSQVNRDRYEQYRPMIDKYRNDVGLIHGTLALPRNAVDEVIDTARGIVRGRQPEVAPVPAFVAGQCAVPAHDPTTPGHPDHALYGQIRRGVHALDASLGRVPDEASDRLSASLLLHARQDGLERVDHVLRSVRSPHASAGDNIFAVQGALNDPGQLRTQVNTLAALGTPAEDSFRRLEAFNQEQPLARAWPSMLESQQAPQPAAPAFSR